mmetsp:Transcript_47508/g.154352  ORF Transcript_47508/g.154352 Transcript_47508/m.154352 type:complete len:480 (+) Transcript_47508:126-1565(+)
MVAMTADMLQRGAALNGDTHGLLRCFADKCDDPSRTLHVVALGTSISAGHGVKKSSRTFAASFAHRIRTVGRAVAVVEHNLGMPGHQPHAVEHCLSSHLPETPDMVLVEYAAMPDPVGFERVVRRLLGHPASPAVVIVNLPSFAQGPSPLPKQTAAEIFARNRTLHALAEFDAIAAHYGLPTSSLWPAVSSRVLQNDSQYQLQDLYLESMHPSEAGHDLVGQLLGELLRQARELGGSAAPGGAGKGACRPRNATALPRPYLGKNAHWANETPAEASCLKGRALGRWIAGSTDWTYAPPDGRRLSKKEGWVPGRAANSSIHFCAETGTHRSARGTWLVAVVQSHGPEWGSVEAWCSGACTDGSRPGKSPPAPRVVHGWNPLLRGQSTPNRASYTVTKSVHFVRESSTGERPPYASGGSCRCMLSLRLIEPRMGRAPYYANATLEPRVHGRTFKLVGLALADGRYDADSLRMPTRMRRSRS